jgi:hypothetical protein
MAFIFFPTLVVAALGLSAARAGDLLRSPLFERNPCAANTSAVVWEYEATPREPRGSAREMQPGAWSPVRRSGSC